MRVLVVEDDQSVRETMVMTLEALGHKPWPAEDLEKATNFLYTAQPEVVLLDLLLNGVIGTPFIEVARQLMGDKAPRIIVLSAMHGAEKVAEANHTGFLAKPFTLEDLADAIDGKEKGPESKDPSP